MFKFYSRDYLLSLLVNDFMKGAINRIGNGPLSYSQILFAFGLSELLLS